MSSQSDASAVGCDTDDPTYDTPENRQSLEKVLSSNKWFHIDPLILQFHDKALGHGGYGVVRRAYLLPVGPDVAVKQLFVPRRSLIRMALRVAREMKIWSLLKHPNILPFFGYHISADFSEAYLISQYLPGGSVRARLDSNPNFPEADRRKWLSGILNGLRYLHGRNPPVVHGDLKAANILLNLTDDAVLCDFGLTTLAQEVSEGPSDEESGEPEFDMHDSSGAFQADEEGFFQRTLTLNNARNSGFATSNGFKGSVPWSSPEALKQASRGTPSDIWALGMTTLEIMTGRMPYYTVKPVGRVVIQILKGTLPRHQHYPEIEDKSPLWQFLHDCWKYNGQRRPDARTCLRNLPSPDVTSSRHNISAVNYIEIWHEGEARRAFSSYLDTFRRPQRSQLSFEWTPEDHSIPAETTRSPCEANNHCHSVDTDEFPPYDLATQKEGGVYKRYHYNTGVLPQQIASAPGIFSTGRLDVVKISPDGALLAILARSRTSDTAADVLIRPTLGQELYLCSLLIHAPTPVSGPIKMIIDAGYFSEVQFSGDGTLLAVLGKTDYGTSGIIQIFWVFGLYGLVQQCTIQCPFGPRSATFMGHELIVCGPPRCGLGRIFEDKYGLTKCEAVPTSRHLSPRTVSLSPENGCLMIDSDTSLGEPDSNVESNTVAELSHVRVWKVEGSKLPDLSQKAAIELPSNVTAEQCAWASDSILLMVTPNGYVTAIDVGQKCISKLFHWDMASLKVETLFIAQAQIFGDWLLLTVGNIEHAQQIQFYRIVPQIISSSPLQVPPQGYIPSNFILDAKASFDPHMFGPSSFQWHIFGKRGIVVQQSEFCFTIYDILLRSKMEQALERV